MGKERMEQKCDGSATVQRSKSLTELCPGIVIRAG